MSCLSVGEHGSNPTAPPTPPTIAQAATAGWNPCETRQCAWARLPPRPVLRRPFTIRRKWALPLGAPGPPDFSVWKFTTTTRWRSEVGNSRHTFLSLPLSSLGSPRAWTCPVGGGGDWGVCPAWKPPSRWCSLLTTHRGRRPSYASPCSSPETVVGSLGWGPFLLAHRCTPRGGGPASHLPHKPPLPGTALQKRQAQASCVSICR